MRIPTTEQKAILEAIDARVRVVRAVPGSGKTWLVAEVIREELASWRTRTSGIAALSFTRVGSDEIRRAVGHDIGHPHFVGTIDAFLFRYVIRPHLRQLFDWFAAPRILVGEWGAEHWGRCGPGQNATVGNHGIKLFGCVFIGEENGEPTVYHKPHPAQPLKRIVGDDLDKVNAAKMEVWKRRGLITHSDAALWASKILGHPTLGNIVRAEIIRRFPLLIVDELQDTGHFLGKCIRLLLQEPTGRGVLVGDPDQAIYEFSGARPDLFATFEEIPGAVRLPLSSSLRCPLAVARAASHLKDSGANIGPAEGRQGRAILVKYGQMGVDVAKIVAAALEGHRESSVKVIARASKTVNELLGRSAAEGAPKLHCPQLTHMHRGVVALRRSRNISALAAARAALEGAVFEYEGVSDEELILANVDPYDWKKLAVRCLLKANAIVSTGNFHDWQSRTGLMLEEEMVNSGLAPCGGFVRGKLRPKKRDGWDKPTVEFLPKLTGGAQPLGSPAFTVHGVKGETHDVTIFVCPQTGVARCPSRVWWSPEDKDCEEKRIAYVAMTRTCGDLVFCVSEECHNRLIAERTAFVQSFECMTVAECVSSFGRSVGSGQQTSAMLGGPLDA